MYMMQARSRMRIGKVAEQTGLSIDAIRFYERSGLLPEPVRTEGGFRLFSDSDVQNLRFLRRAQELGFSLTEIKELIFIRDRRDHTCKKVHDLLGMKLENVRAKIAELKALESELNQSLRACKRDLRRADNAPHHQEHCPVLEKLERRGQGGRTRD